MPVITVEGTKLSKEQKSQLAKALTVSSANIMNVPEQAMIVIIRENERENIGVGGTLLADK